jgi:hypothetical protein
MRRDDLCDFCAGAGHHFYLRLDRPAHWFCQPCKGTGTSRPSGPVTLRIGAAQGKKLKPYPKDTP